MAKKGVKAAIGGMNEDAAAYYSELLEVLKEDGRFKTGDERGLARLCYLYSVADKLEAEINGAWGQALPKSNMPYYDKICKNVIQLESAFQLNPNSRKQKAKEGPKEKKGFDTGMKVTKTA